MSYQIRSADKQGSFSKIDLSKTQTRDDILEALRGIVIEFELKIDDLIEHSIGEQNDDKKQELGALEAVTISVKKDSIISDLKTKLNISKCKQVLESDVEVIGAPESVTVSQKGENGFAGSAKPVALNPPKPRTVSKMRIFKRVSAISPRPRKP